MSRKTQVNVIIICILLASFPMLWIYNQRLNYRKVLTLNTKFNLNANTEDKANLTSIQYILDDLKHRDVGAQLNVDVKTYKEFGVVGRVIDTKFGNLEVYEYSSNADAKKTLNAIKNNEGNYFHSYDIYQYRNFLILNTQNNGELSVIFGNNTYEKVD